MLDKKAGKGKHFFRNKQVHFDVLSKLISDPYLPNKKTHICRKADPPFKLGRPGSHQLQGWVSFGENKHKKRG
jgi:hypothetical protein